MATSTMKKLKELANNLGFYPISFIHHSNRLLNKNINNYIITKI